MKKIFFVVLLIVFVFLFVGCGEVVYSVVIDDVGGRVYDYRVTLDANSSHISQNIQLIRTYFEYKKSSNEYAEIIYDENEPNSIIYRVSFESQTEYLQYLGITGDEPNEPSSYTEKGFFRIYEDILLDYNKADFAGFALDYLSHNVVSEENLFDTRLRSALLSHINDPSLSKVANECVIRICNDKDRTTSDSLRLELSISEVSDEIANLTYRILKDMGYDYAKISAVFEYSHPYKTFEGLDANKVETIQTDLGKQKVYSWNLDLLGDNEIRYVSKSPNVWVWEVIAISFGLLVAGVSLIVFFIRKKKIFSTVGAQKSNKFERNSKTEKQNKSNLNNDVNNSSTASWFANSNNNVRMNDNNVKNDKNNAEEDVFGGYFDDGDNKDKNITNKNE